MEKSINFLVDEKMDTPENFEKLNKIVYTNEARIIAWIPFSREKFVPEVRFNDEPNKYGVFESKEEGIYRAEYNDLLEYYLTPSAYTAQAEMQWKKVIRAGHIRSALKALPGNFSHGDSYIWWNIIWNILDLSMSDAVNWNGRLCFPGEDGTLCYGKPLLPVNMNEKRFLKFDNKVGGLRNDYSIDEASPCLFIVTVG